jgi:hypothetical protein
MEEEDVGAIPLLERPPSARRQSSARRYNLVGSSPEAVQLSVHGNPPPWQSDVPATPTPRTLIREIGYEIGREISSHLEEQQQQWLQQQFTPLNGPSLRSQQAKGEPTIVAFPVKVFKDGTTPIGIQLQGTAGEPPTIIEVDPNSPAARCRPQLQVGMRILAINGQRVLGPQEISRLLRNAVGIVEMEVSQKIEGDAHPNLASGALLTAPVGSALVPLVRVAELRNKTLARKREREREAAPFAVFTRAAGGAGSALASVAGGVGSAFASVAGGAGSAFATGTPKPAKNVTPRQFKVLLRNPQGAFSLGLVLGGTQDEAPRITQVIAC